MLCVAIPARAQDDRKFTMREAVALALQNSRDLALARVQYKVALNAAGVDHAAFRPNIYTGSGAAYTYGFPFVGRIATGCLPAELQPGYFRSGVEGAAAVGGRTCEDDEAGN